MRIDIYRVGVLRNLYAAWRSLTCNPPPSVTWNKWDRARQNLRIAVSSPLRHIRNRQWHELKNDFNGYLAEPTPWPEGATRCGSGWTKRRALRSLQRNIRRPGVHWDECNREIETMLGDAR